MKNRMSLAAFVVPSLFFGFGMGSISICYAQQMPVFGGFEVKTLTKEEKHYQTAAYICALKLENGPEFDASHAWEINFSGGRTKDDETIVYSITAQVCP